ncbi:hypothetical protein VE03_10560 [Pseudogymnoascus sp. 23342-1-I1]|nr:hypothetical protein VE03_10560 [Pseudogymnoascus sp. 23342-1-I1]
MASSLEKLPVEIILNIVIQLGWRPRDIRSLLGSCKIIRVFLKAFEKPLSRRFASHLYPASTHLIHSSSIQPLIIFPHTFAWLAEKKKRTKILRELSNSPLLDITIPNLLLSLFETSTRICGSCGLLGINAFKSHGLNVLLRLADARVAGSVSIDDAQHGQEFWIRDQDPLALASALALVWVASLMFEYGDSSTWGAGGDKDNHATPGESSAEESNLVKRQYIYRELALAHGPYFLWCSVSESAKETRWAKKMLDEGAKGLEEYGVGSGPANRNLQSAFLGRLAGLQGWKGWDEM